MKMRKVTAIKPHKYGTRQLTAGEEYEVPPRHAVALVAGKKARFADKPDRKKTPAAIPQAEPVESEPEPANIDSLRMQATQLGINIDGRWGVARLQQEIAARR